MKKIIDIIRDNNCLSIMEEIALADYTEQLEILKQELESVKE